MNPETQTPEQKLFADIRNAFDGAGGQLEQNNIFSVLFNKISKQYIIDNFDYEDVLLKAYIKESTLVGSLDEIAAFGFADRDDFDINADWTKDQYIIEDYAIWAPRKYEDVYKYTIFYDQMARAMQTESNLASVMALFKRAISDKKTNEWYNRIRDMHKQYKFIVELDGVDPEANAKKITEYMKKVSLPSTEYNLAGKPTAIKRENLQLTWNVKALNDTEWLGSKLFNAESIKGFGSMMNKNFVDYQDDNVIAVLDTPNSLHIAKQFAKLASQDMAMLKKVNYYLHETYLVIAVPFEVAILFKMKETETDKKPLSTVITTQEIEVEGVPSEATILEAVKAANAELDDVEVIITINSAKSANVLASNKNAKYFGNVKVSIKAGEAKKF